MRAFSLEEYIKNPNQKVITRDGRNVKILSTDYYHSGKRFVLAEAEGDDCSFVCNSFGVQYPSAYSSLDLFFAPEKHEGWLNIYRSDECGFYMRGKSPYKSKEKADKVAKANPKTFFTTIKVEWGE